MVNSRNRVRVTLTALLSTSTGISKFICNIYVLLLELFKKKCASLDNFFKIFKHCRSIVKMFKFYIALEPRLVIKTLNVLEEGRFPSS